VRFPKPAEDRPSWTKLGVITAIGFLVGVLWPRLAGVRLGPAVPEAPSATVAAAPPSASAERAAVPPAAIVASAPPFVRTAPPSADVPSAPSERGRNSVAPANERATVSVGHGAIFACNTSAGDSLKGGACGNLPGLDSAIMPRLRKIADCPEAAAATGTLHLVVRVDFSRDALGVDLARTQAVSSPDGLLACARAAVAGASLNNIAHDNARYSVAYLVEFGTATAGESAALSARVDAAPAVSAPAETAAQVVWEVALVRDVPKTGKVIARLQRGVAVRVGAMKDGWLPVKYGDGFSSEGWVYRGAIGK